MPVFRNSPPELIALFDAANPSMVTGRRDVSTVAPQSLYLMNSPFAVDQAKHAAERLLADESMADDDRIRHAYRLTLGRLPTESERSVVTRYLAGDSEPVDAWAGLFQALFASAEFRYVR